MNITDVTGLSEHQKATLQALGAVEDSGSTAASNLVFLKLKNSNSSNAN